MSLRCWSIRIAIATAASIAAPLTLAAASCDTPDPCAARACRLDAEIARAKAKGNTKALTRLERERAGMSHCSDDGLKQKRKVALEQAQQRIDKREAELKRVEATGNAGKTKKAQRNLESARKAYAEIEKTPL
ncbi:MAG: DUF1090 domain-containing protein [Betaproteobacteria bacterium]|nr:MAG: DUF1090 domain-containing protein [Betaproteobacteria bacterium]